MTHSALAIEEIGSYKVKFQFLQPYTPYLHMISPFSHNSRPSTLPVLLVIYLFVSLTSSVTVQLTESDPLLTLTFETGGKHTLYVVSSGTETHDIQVLINSDGKLLFNKTGTDMEYSYDFGMGTANVTFSSVDGGARNVSFDFESDEDPFVKIIDKKDLAILEDILSQVHRIMKTISLNQQFHIERDDAHKTTLEESESHIKWTGIVKIVFLLTSALLQLWIMKGFFKNSGGQSYHPVQSGEQS